MENTPLKKDLQKVIEDILSQSYAMIEEDDDYQQGFSEEGGRKAQYIVDDLRYRESQGKLRIAELGYLSIGGADGSEIAWMLKETAIPKGVIIEISDSGAARARERAKTIQSLGKNLVVIQGDAMTMLDQALQQLEKWLAAGEITGLVCSAQAVLHELPRRSATFDLTVFLGKLFRDSKWSTCSFYSREPGRPEGWPEKVQIRIPGVKGESLVKFATYTRDRLSMEGAPVAFAAEWVGLPSMLAVETLHKLIRGNSLKRIGYELGEQLTEFEPIDVKKQLESLINGMQVSVERITTRGFKRALDQYSVNYMGHKAEPLPVPRTHSEIIGFACIHPPAVKLPPTTDQRRGDLTPPPPLSDSEVQSIFSGEIKKQDVDSWLNQFAPNERVYVAALLRGFKYYGKQGMYDLYRKLYQIVIEKLGDVDPLNMRFVQLGGPAKSGALVAYQFRVANQLNSNLFIESASLSGNEDFTATPLVFLDDILASGHQAALTWQSLISEKKLTNGARVLLATLVGTPAGARYLEERTTFETCSAVILDESNDPLSMQSMIFPDVQAREVAREIVQAYGKRLIPHAPFGYLGSGMLVSFNHGTPDNTLPIFWSRNNDWRPLLDAGGSTRLSAVDTKSLPQ